MSLGSNPENDLGGMGYTLRSLTDNSPLVVVCGGV